jgi:arylsulfatase A-like enzyme
MTRSLRNTACVLAVLAAAVLEPAARGADAPRPNVVFILVDDLRWDALGCMGHPFSRTPNIDRIAAEGAKFRNAFVTTPLCSPARGTFLTGQYVHTHGVKGNSNASAPLSHELVTWPRLLKEAGYRSAYVGKWHMGNDDSPRPGFDRWVSFKGQGAHVDPVINVDGKAEKVQGYMTDILTDHAVEWISRPREGKQPFSLYLAYKAVHGPFIPAERHRGLYPDEPIKRAPSAQDTLEGKPVLTRQVEGLRPLGPGTGSGDLLIRNQLRMLAAIDDGVGRVLKALEQAKEIDNTVVVFTSDNGYLWGEHGLGDKRAAYEESIRVPLVARYPKVVRPGTVVNGIALDVDIAPTLLELAGAPVRKGIHGRSLVPLLRGSDSGWRRSALAEYFTEPNYPRIPSWQAVRTGRWKYIRYTELDGMDELYDLQADPYEMKNRIADPAAGETLRELKKELERLLKETGAPS